MKRLNEINYSALSDKCEQLIRLGDGQAAARIITHLSLHRLPREYRRPFANFARRLNLSHRGLRMLTPLILTRKGSSEPPASDDEKAEYALLLQKVGASKEALQILLAIPATQNPKIFLYRSLSYLGTWEYEKARDQLQRYLKNAGLDPYARAVGMVNLTAIHVFLGEATETKDLLAFLLPACQERGFHRLYANCLEIRCQIAIREGDYALAQDQINAAAATLRETASFERLFIEKWAAVIQLKQGDSEPALRFRAAAEANGYWEGMRDIDFHLIQARQDEELFRFLYFGTPHPAYRKILLDNTPFQAPSHYQLGHGSTVFELGTGKLNGQEIPVWRGGRPLHQLLALLFSDFYAPFRVGTIFSELFPGEKFNIASSPNRVHQLVSRTRENIETMRLPITITERHKTYSAAVAKNGKVIITNQPTLPRPGELELQRLAEVFGTRPFSAREATDVLRISLSSFARLIRPELSRGFVKLGKGRNTRYQKST